MSQVRPEILASVEPEDVEAALRSCLLKLQFLETSLKPLPTGEERRERGEGREGGGDGRARACPLFFFAPAGAAGRVQRAAP
jgi:hypothetical protein